MEHTKKSNILRSLINREAGIGYGCRRIPRDKTLQIYAEEAASLPNKNLHCELSGQPRSTLVMSFSRDCSRIASTHGDHTIRVTDVRSGKCTHVLPGHSRTPWCIAFHPSSNEILASGCLAGEVRIWDLQGGGSEVWRSPEGFSVASLAFHPADNVLVFAIGNKLRFWSWKQTEPFLECRTSREFEKIRWVKFDPLGHTVYTGIANGSTVTAADDHFYAAERSRSGLADRYGRFGRTANDPTPDDGELSYLLNRNDYDLPGLSVREDRDGQNVWTYNSSNRTLSNPSASEATSRNSSEGGSLFVHATAALANARRYAARETSRHYSSTDSSVSRAVAWDAVPPLRRHALLHGWDNPSVSDVSRRRHRLFNFVNNRSLLDLPDPSPDWSSWHPPYTIDLRSSNSSMNASAISSEPRHGSSSRDYDPFLSTPGSDGSRRATDRRADGTSGSSGSVPTVVVTWENDGAASRPVMDDVGPDNESEEVTSTAAEAGSTASLGESIDADLERSTLDVETSMSSGSEVAASGSLSSDTRNIFGGTMLVDLLSPSRPVDWDVVSSDAAAAATARRYGQLPVMPEDVDLSGPRRWRRFSRRQADSEANGRRMRRDHSYASSSTSFTPSVFNDDSSSSLRRADSPAGHDFIEYAEDLLSRIMETNSLDTAQPQPYQGSSGVNTAASASTDSSSALHSAFQSNNDTTLHTAEEEVVNRRLAYVSSGNTECGHQRQLNTSSSVCPVLSESYLGTVNQNSNAASSDAAQSSISCESRRPTLAASWLGNSSSSAGTARTFIPQSLVSRHSDWSADSSSSRQLRNSYSGQSPSAQPTVPSGTFSARPDLLGSSAHQEIAHTSGEELNLNVTEESVLEFSNSESVPIPPTSMQSAISLSSSVNGAAAQDTTSDYAHHFSSTSSYEQSMGAASQHQSAMPSPRTRALGTSSSGHVHPLHNNRPNCEICSGSNASVFRCFSSQERRRLPSRLSQITFDRLRSTRTPREPSFDSIRSVYSELRRRSNNANWPVLPSFESRTAAHSGINRLPSESIPPTTSTWNPSSSSGSESTIAEFEQRMRQVDERVSRIQLRLMEHAAWRREHMDNSRFSGLSDLRDRLRERQERMRAHLEELRTRFGRSASRSADSSRTTGLGVGSTSDPLLTSSAVSGFGSTGADAVGEFIANEDREVIVNRLRSIPDEIRLINVEMNRNARNLRRPTSVWDDPSNILLDPNDPSDNDDRVQAAINQAIHGAFIANGGEASVGSNIMDQTFRIQAWDFADHRPPNLSDTTSNVVVHRAKLHNDASCDIALDGSLLCTFIQTSRSGFAGSGDVTLGIFSLVPANRGQCLYKKSFGPNAISVSFSPLHNYVLVGLASKRFSWIFTPKQVVAQVYRLRASHAAENSLEQVGDILHSCDMDFRAPVSMNSARWLLAPGDGLVYGTNRGDLHICRPGVDQRDKPEVDNGELPNDSNPMRQSLMQMLGLSVPRMASAATQTGASARRSASTQTELLYGNSSSTSSSESSARSSTRD